MVIHVAQVIRSKGDQRLSAPGSRYELDLEHIRCVHFDDRAQVALTKTSVRDVAH